MSLESKLPLSLQVILKLGKYSIPIYGDIKIHNLFSRARRYNRGKLQDLREKRKELDKREERFRQDLSDLLKKYEIREVMGSPVSFPSEYIAKERYSQGTAMLSAGLTLEIGAYIFKYFFLYELYNCVTLFSK